MKKQCILVTGASGFTGGHLSNRLVTEGHPVRALVRDPSRCEHLRQAGVELAKGDFRDAESVKQAMKGIEAVYHVGALYRQENVSRQEMWDSNVLGTKILLDASIENGVQKFIHCSTIGVHGDIKNPPGDENTPYSPGDRYQESKTEGEKLVLDYASHGRLPIVVFRPGGIFGPGDLRFLKLFKAIKTRRFIMFGSGEVRYQMVYIDDLVDAILLCGTQQNAIGNIYILTGEGSVTLNQLVLSIAQVLDVKPPQLRLPVMPLYFAGFVCEILCKPFGINPPVYRRRVDFFRKTRWFDISKAKRELGFQPKVSLKDGLKRTAIWYKEQGLL